MRDLEPVRCGCGGEAKVEEWVGRWYVRCQNSNCLISTKNCDTEAEAITAWNRAMGTDARTLMKVFAYDATCAVCEKKERTAKATRKPEAFFYRCECGYGLCCEKNDMNYCPHCGCRLEWE
jgi:hypothetical protein